MTRSRPPAKHPDPPDNHFVLSEELFRRLKEDDILNSMVLTPAIDYPGCSFNRSKYSQPSEVFDQSEPDYNKIGAIKVGNIPPPVDSPGGVKFEFFVAHDPRIGNYSHTEIRLRKQNEEYNPRLRIKSKIFRREVREKIAERMYVLNISPPPPN